MRHTCVFGRPGLWGTVDLDPLNIPRSIVTVRDHKKQWALKCEESWIQKMKKKIEEEGAKHKEEKIHPRSKCFDTMLKIYFIE